MNIKVVTLPKYRIAYVRQVGPYGPGNIQAMEKLKKWAEDKHLIAESAIMLGIAQDNPETTLPENCRYDACIVISNDYQIDNSICESELSGGKYFICKVKHTAEDIQKAWAEIFPALQNSGYQIDNKPIFERYNGDMIYNDYCEICVPVKPF
ncbi:GyrI-like domain-containing protein [Paenibacillus sp. GP183]|uniref:AraC family transcriptional regulator n=1 Tax=Paenibacillus sp. GP183 TaxID=1882751 RepID=UPI00089D8AB8|nr:GyrI-like domain-containing protein [Paenibacillus sp. GP183]SEC04061.1 DNA gyrase inhibitor GyrI [Paenibacillus sp. GP183]